MILSSDRKTEMDLHPLNQQVQDQQLSLIKIVGFIVFLNFNKPSNGNGPISCTIFTQYDFFCYYN